MDLKIVYALLLTFFAGFSIPALGDGQIAFGNRNLTAASGLPYHVPIWIDNNGNGVRDEGEGLGSFAAAFGATATLGLFVEGSVTPIITSSFRTDVNGGSFTTASTGATAVHGYFPGERAPLTVKAWIGGSYETAIIRGAWNFLSQPLGGISSGGSPFLPPDLGGWGDPSGVGYALDRPVGPVAAPDLMVRRTGRDGAILISALLANDSDPSGGSLAFMSTDALSVGGASISVVGDAVVYRSVAIAGDHFFYTIRNTTGGFGRGRIDVAVDDLEGVIEFSNATIPKAAGGTYGAPIFVDANFDGVVDPGEGFGAFAMSYYSQTAKLGLFLRGGVTPLAVAEFAANPSGSAYVQTPVSQWVAVPGVLPGAAVELTIKAWLGADFESSPLKAAWDFSSRPLGGSILGGGTFAIPGLTGWGSENGDGFGIVPGPRPITGGDEVTRPYRQDVTVEVATLLANDTDPEGAALVFVGVDATSNGGASIAISETTITYRRNVEATDYFFYSVRSAHGVVAKGRVDVIVGAAEGDIRLANRGLPLAAGAGTFDVPIWVDVNFNGVREASEGLGTFAQNHLAQPATLGIFAAGQATPIALGVLATDSTGAFIAATNEVFATVPGSTPGQSVPLTIKVWTGATYETAAFKRSWDILSPPLGGPRTGQEALPTPSLLGWGPENGEGFMFSLGERPAIGTDFIIRASGQDGAVPVLTLLGNDLDPSGGVITLIGVDPQSQFGAPVTFLGSTITYAAFGDFNDSFGYTVQLANGGLATGRVEVIVDDADGAIFLSNRFVRKSAGVGAYHVPVWVDANFNGRRDAEEGLGAFARAQFETNATLGLYLRDGTSPLATALFPTHGASAFLDDPVFQTVTIPGFRPGAVAPLTVKVWAGANFETAIIRGSWDFTSLPLGGGKAGVGVFATPDISGLGNESVNDGLKIIPGSQPVTYGSVLIRSVGQNANTPLAVMKVNDSDPDGGPLTIVSVDEESANGAVLTVLGNTLYYLRPLADSDAPDVFEYTVRNAKGGLARGRVDVVVTDAGGVFKTRLAIEHTAEGARLRFRGIIGAAYRVEARENFEETWNEVGVAAPLGFGLFEVNDPTGSPARFYRVLALP